MSIFSQMAAGARANHGHYFGDSVTLAEPGSAARTVDAVLGAVQIETRPADGRELRIACRSCRFLGATSVRHDATVTIDGVIWSIDEFIDKQASRLTVKLKRTAAHEVARTGYRGKG